MQGRITAVMIIIKGFILFWDLLQFSFEFLTSLITNIQPERRNVVNIFELKV